jgi:cytochrome c
MVLAACGENGEAADDEAEALTLPAEYAEADASNGPRLWVQCRTCHQIADGAAIAVGPDLHGIFGRTAATNESFAAYSPALTESGIVWTAETMDAWIENPRATAPTTTMIFPGMPDAQDRRDLIAWLWDETGAAGEGDEE